MAEGTGEEKEKVNEAITKNPVKNFKKVKKFLKKLLTNTVK